MNTDSQKGSYMEAQHFSRNACHQFLCLFHKQLANSLAAVNGIRLFQSFISALVQRLCCYKCYHRNI